MFENRILRRIFGRKRGKAKGGCRKLHSDEVDNFYSLPNIIKMIKLKRLRYV
jgi:hypothetical protein